MNMKFMNTEVIAGFAVRILLGRVYGGVYGVQQHGLHPGILALIMHNPPL